MIISNRNYSIKIQSAIINKASESYIMAISQSKNSQHTIRSSLFSKEEKKRFNTAVEFITQCGNTFQNTTMLDKIRIYNQQHPECLALAEVERNLNSLLSNIQNNCSILLKTL